jgi:hypothetical protein
MNPLTTTSAKLTHNCSGVICVFDLKISLLKIREKLHQNIPRKIEISKKIRSKMRTKKLPNIKM